MIEREMLEYTTAELWETLLGRDEVARCQALDELAEREDNTIAPLVVASLARGLALPCDMTPMWRNALIKATPRIQVTDESLRSVLASSLLKHAFDLKHGGGDEGILWTAIRRYATLRPEADIARMSAFLDDHGNLPRLHVVLLSLQNAFYSWAPTEQESQSFEYLRDQVSWTAHKFLNPVYMHEDNECAVARSSLCAAAAIGCPDLLRLTEKAIALKEKWLVEMARQEISSRATRWKHWGKESDQGVVALVHASIEMLAKAC